MMAYSSTSIRMFDRHCPAALGFHESGTPRDREVFAVGIAAHACIQALCEAARQSGGLLDDENSIRSVLDATVAILISEGREFAGVPEPPLSPTSATAGRDIVLAYLARRPWTDGGLPVADARVEAGLAITKDGEPVAYGSGAARWQAVIDGVEHVEDYWREIEMIGAPAIVIWEYKTAWPTDASELDTIQTRGQAVLAHAHHPDRLIVRRVVNLRTSRWYEHVLDPDDPDDAKTLFQWRTDILSTCTAADLTRAARPGAGCHDCAWVLRCEDALHVDGDAATEYAVATARVAELGKMLRVKAYDSPIPVEGGEVGYRIRARATPVKDAHRQLAAAWHRKAPTAQWCAEHGSWISLIGALEIGATNVQAAAKAMHPARREKRARDALAGSMLEDEPFARWGVWPGGANR